MTDAHVFRATHTTHPIKRDQLAAYLSSRQMVLDPSTPILQFATGLANINYKLRVNDRDVVLRRPPDGDLPPGAHDMKREHHVLSKLSKVFKAAPDSLHLCEDASIIGVPFQIMEYRPGRVIKGDDRSFIGDDKQRAAKIGEMLIAAMTELHSTDAESAGLLDLGRPDGFIQRAISGWRSRADRLQPPGNMKHLTKEIGTWLQQQTTRYRPPTLLHCDLKLDNCILDPETLELRAIVDWDMGTRGDPLFDLATLTSYWTEAEDPPCMHVMAQMPTAAPGFQTRDEIVSLYARKSGCDVSDYPVIRILCMFKLATVFHQLFATYGRNSSSGEIGSANTSSAQDIGTRNAYAGFQQLAEDMYAYTHATMRTSG